MIIPDVADSDHVWEMFILYSNLFILYACIQKSSFCVPVFKSVL